MLTVESLQTQFGSNGDASVAVDDVSFSVAAKSITAVVGESGSGKSVTALSILRLLPRNARVTGRIIFDGRDLLTLSDDDMRAVRGRRIGTVFQEPMSALNPVLPIGRQVSEVLQQHLGMGRREAANKAVMQLERVALAEPARVAKQYPHQLSGGMRQRVMIAIAIAANPDLIIADEPTTALDVTVQAQILALLKSLTRDQGRSMLLITHDFGVVAAMADHVVVMYAGRVVERGPTRQVLAQPRHPYTAALLGCMPSLHGPRQMLPVIPGGVPDPALRPSGCRFQARCSMGAGDERCASQDPDMHAIGADHEAACWKSEQI